MVVGKVQFESKDDTIRTDDYKEFFILNKGNEQLEVALMSEKQMKQWALLLNSPWSQTCFSYEIELNCENSYTEIDEDDPKWRCIYSTVGYAGIEASCIGYGDTEEEALKNCKMFLERLQKEYNADGDAI